MQKVQTNALPLFVNNFFEAIRWIFCGFEYPWVELKLRSTSLVLQIMDQPLPSRLPRLIDLPFPRCSYTEASESLYSFRLRDRYRIHELSRCQFETAEMSFPRSFSGPLQLPHSRFIVPLIGGRKSLIIPTKGNHCTLLRASLFQNTRISSVF